MKAAKVFNRGVVIGPPLQQNGLSITTRGDTSSRLARFSALYFDKAIFPDNNLISVGLDSDAKHLTDIGFAKVQLLRFGSFYDGKVNGEKPLPDAIMDGVFAKLPASQRHKWSILDDENRWSGVTNLQGEYSAIFLDVFSKFPCPNDETPIQEIIKFNASHRKTLHALRIGISQLAERMALAQNAADIANAVSVEIDTHLEELDGLLTKTGFQALKESLTIGFQLPSTTIALIFSMLGVPSGVAAPLSNSLSISAGHNPYKSRFQSVDWAYILSAQKKGIV